MVSLEECVVVYRWRYQDENGREVVGPEVTFEDQIDAEDWLGEQWRGLHTDGVAQVTLLQGESEVYGPMGLGAA